MVSKIFFLSGVIYERPLSDALRIVSFNFSVLWLCKMFHSDLMTKYEVLVLTSQIDLSFMLRSILSHIYSTKSII